MQEPHKKEKKEINRPSYIQLALSFFIILIALLWFVRGQVILPNKGIYIFGNQARIVSVLIAIIGGYPWYRYLSKRR